MKNILNKACMFALLSGAVLAGPPAFAAGAGVSGGVGAPGAGANAGVGMTNPGMTGPGSVNGSIASPPGAGANAGIGMTNPGMTSPGSVNGSIATAPGVTAGTTTGTINGGINTTATGNSTTESPASQMSRRAEANANAATTRQLNQPPAVSSNSLPPVGQTVPDQATTNTQPPAPAASANGTASSTANGTVNTPAQ